MGEAATYTGKVTSAAGLPVPGVEVALTASAGTVAGTTPGPIRTAGDGTFTFTYTAGWQPGTVTLTATAGSVEGQAIVTVVQTPARITLEAARTTLRTGQTTVLQGLVGDSFGQPIPGVTVTLSTGRGSTHAVKVTTNPNGRYTATYTAPDEGGPDSVTATAGDVWATVTLTIEAKPRDVSTENEAVRTVEDADQILLVATSDLGVELTFPANSLPEGTVVTILRMEDTVTPPQGHGPASPVWDFDTAGVEPEHPANLRMRVTLPEGAAAKQLALYTLVNGQWKLYGFGQYDPETGWLTAKLAHLSSWTVLTVPQPYTDVPVSHWAFQAISELKERGILIGSMDTYRPEANVTRAEFVQMLMSTLGIAPQIAAEPMFSDIPSGHPYEGYLHEAGRVGILKGDGTGRANPDQSLTRQEAAVLMMRAMEYAKVQGDPSGEAPVFGDDAKIPGWARAAVSQAASWRIILGYPDGTFQPGRNLGRAEAASLASKLLVMMEHRQ